MKISRKDLKKIVDTLLYEAVNPEWVCPKCGAKHDKEPEEKCKNCGHEYDDPWQGKKWLKPKENISEQK